jgi:hypothetical protein
MLSITAITSQCNLSGGREDYCPIHAYSYLLVTSSYRPEISMKVSRCLHAL